MPWVAAAAAVVGAAVSSDSSRSAANTQADAANKATDTQKQMFDTTNAQQAPWRQAGTNALNAMQYGMGIGGAPQSTQAGYSSLSGMAGDGSAGWMGGPRDLATLTPTQGAGGSPMAGMGYGSLTHQFNADDLKTNLAPNYQFMLGQGLGAVNNQASVSGGLVGGNALKGINDYAQNYASNGYQQAFDNFNTQQTNIYNRLSNIAGLGQTANGQSAQAALGFGSNIGSGQLAAGAARAAGYVGAGNAISSGLSNAASWYAMNNGGGSNNLAFSQGAQGSSVPFNDSKSASLYGD